MPRISATVLCVILIATYPKLIGIGFDYVQDVDDKCMAYILMVGMILVLPGLVAYFIRVAHKAQSTAFDELLRALANDELIRALANSIGRDRGNSKTKTSDGEQQKTPCICTHSGSGKADHVGQS